MSVHARAARSFAFLAALAVGSAVAAPAVLAHERRDVAGYEMEVGFIDEPVFVGERSGLDLFVHKGDQPVGNLDKTLRAQVIYGSSQLDLPLSADDDDPSHYTSVFIPTAAGPYTFHITGTIAGTPIDERFTSSPTGFDEVRDVASGQFPNRLPSTVELAAEAKQGADAAAQLPIALGIGGAGALIGLVALGVSLAGRRRAA